MPSVEIEDESKNPFEEAASHEVQQAVQQALREVPEVFRSAVILRDLEGMSYEEVAEVLGVSVGTVKSRILRGRRLLREILEPLLRSPRAQAAIEAAKAAANRSGTLAQSRSGLALHSPLFSLAANKSSGRPDTAGWADSGKPGDAEGGV